MSRTFLPKPILVPLIFLALLIPGFSHAQRSQSVVVPSIWPRGSVWHNELWKATRNIERKTDGRVEIRLEDQAVLEYVPELGVFSLPLMFRSDQELDFVRKKMDSRLMQVIRDKGLVPLSLESVGAGHIFTTSSEMSTLQQFQTSQLWIPKGKASSSFNSFGIQNPVSASLPQVKPKMALGKLDTFVATPSTVVLARWPAGRTPLPTPSISRASTKPLMYFVAPLVVYPQGYSKISDADQEVVKAYLIQAFQEASQSNRAKDAEAMQILQRRDVAFVDFVDPTDSEWSSWAKSVTDRLISNGKVPASLTNEVRSHLRAYRGG